MCSFVLFMFPQFEFDEIELKYFNTRLLTILRGCHKAEGMRLSLKVSIQDC